MVLGVLDHPQVDSVGSISVREVVVLALGSSSDSEGDLSFFTGDLLGLPPLESLLIVSVPQIDISVSTMAGDRHEVSVASVLSLRLDGEKVLLSSNGSDSPVVSDSVSSRVLEPDDVVAVVGSTRHHDLIVKLSSSLDVGSLGELNGLKIVLRERSDSDLLLAVVLCVPEIESIPLGTSREVTSVATLSANVGNPVNVILAFNSGELPPLKSLLVVSEPEINVGVSTVRRVRHVSSVTVSSVLKSEGVSFTSNGLYSPSVGSIELIWVRNVSLVDVALQGASEISSSVYLSSDLESGRLREHNGSGREVGSERESLVLGVLNAD